MKNTRSDPGQELLINGCPIDDCTYTVGGIFLDKGGLLG